MLNLFQHPFGRRTMCTVGAVDATNGRRRPCDLMADILITVLRDRIGGVIGQLSARTWRAPKPHC
jgi:hypothetical protein